MSATLYTRAILRLAADPVLHEQVDAPVTQVERRAAVCGSRVAISLRSEGGRVTAFGRRVTACALGQAAATVLARHVIGRNLHEMRTVRDGFAAYLDGKAPLPADWPGLDALAAVREYPARHAAVLLPFDATIEALVMDQA